MNGMYSLLIIDDDPDDRELFMEAVLETGKDLSCYQFGSGVEALQELRNDDGLQPDFIFLDMNMPVMNGRETLIELRKLKRLNSSQIIIYTTSQREDDVKTMLELGASAFLIKPSVFSHLKTAIKFILSGSSDATEIKGLFLK